MYGVNEKVDTTEIEKLYNLCMEAGMNVSIQDMWGGKQVRFYDNLGNLLDDAICHGCSHGHEQGLLETFSLNDCDGYETAEQVFEGWKEWLFDIK